MQRLREALPDVHLALLTHEKLAGLWRTASEPRCGYYVCSRVKVRGQSLAVCAPESFQAALVLPNSPRSALEVWMARIPQRIGYVRPCWSWLLTRAIAPRPGKSRMSKRSASEVSRLISLPIAARSAATPRPHDRPPIKSTTTCT